MSDALAIRRKRLLFRSWHRGTKETDLLLGTFADANLGSFGSAQLDDFERLLEALDGDIWDWFTRRADLPDEHDNDVTRRFLDHRYKPRPA
jgi:antitoxin CptB